MKISEQTVEFLDTQSFSNINEIKMYRVGMQSKVIFKEK